MDINAFFDRIKGIKSINAKYTEGSENNYNVKSNAEFNVVVNRGWPVLVVFLILCVAITLYFSTKFGVDNIYKQSTGIEKLDVKLDAISKQLKQEKEVVLKIDANEFMLLVQSWKSFTPIEYGVLKMDYAFQVLKMILISIIWICMLFAFYFITKSQNNRGDDFV